MVCMERPPTHVAVPCGHHALCAVCTQMCNAQCPVCRQPIDKWIHVYYTSYTSAHCRASSSIQVAVPPGVAVPPSPPGVAKDVDGECCTVDTCSEEEGEKRELVKVPGPSDCDCIAFSVLLKAVAEGPCSAPGWPL